MLFCFFKQKTAYERRMSDWSSDVCSSDLLAAGGFPAVGAPAMDPARDAVPQIDAVRVDADLDRALQRLQPADRCHQLHAVVGRRRLAAVQLDRKSVV